MLSSWCCVCVRDCVCARKRTGREPQQVGKGSRGRSIDRPVEFEQFAIGAFPRPSPSHVYMRLCALHHWLRKPHPSYHIAVKTILLLSRPTLLLCVAPLSFKLRGLSPRAFADAFAEYFDLRSSARTFVSMSRSRTRENARRSSWQCKGKILSQGEFSGQRLFFFAPIRPHRVILCLIRGSRDW
jgi:hypothetical protein